VRRQQRGQVLGDGQCFCWANLNHRTHLSTPPPN
jgi:hypothetical protein